MQNYKFNIASLTCSKQIRHFLLLPVSDVHFILLTIRNKNLLAKCGESGLPHLDLRYIVKTKSLKIFDVELS